MFQFSSVVPLIPFLELIFHHLITFLLFLFLSLRLSLHLSGHLQDGVVRDEDARGRINAREEDGQDLQTNGPQ